MNTTLTGIQNNNDGTYDLTFSENIANVDPGTDHTEPQIALWSPSQNAWFPAVVNADSVATVITITVTGGYNDCTFIAIFGQPTTITAADPFTVVAPQTAVT